MTRTYKFMLALTRGAKTLVMAFAVACIASSLPARIYKRKLAWLVVMASCIMAGGLNFKSVAIQSQPASSLIVSATCYYSGETGSYKTATGKHTSPRYIAVSRDVEKLFPMHTKIVLTCEVNKIYAQVEDRMGCDKKFKPCKPWYRKVDIFKTSKKACKIWGIKKGCRLEKVK